VLATGARLALALRQATRQAGFKAAAAAHIPQWQDASVRTITQDLKSPLFNVTAAANGLDEIAEISHRATPNGAARLGMAIAHALNGDAPIVPGIDAAETALAARIAAALLAAERPLVVSGTGCGSVAVLQAVSNIVGALARLNRKPSISLVFAEANSVGEGLLAGEPLEAALKQMESGTVDTLIVAENDLYRRVPASRLDAALFKVRNIVVLDCIATRTVSVPRPCCRPARSPRRTARWSTTKAARSARSRYSRPRASASRGAGCSRSPPPRA